MKYAIEEILDDQKVFYRIHKNNIDSEVEDPKAKIKPIAFNPQPQPLSVQMSVNWEKYSSAEHTRSVTGKPHVYGVVSFICYDVRHCPSNLKVTHVPTSTQAHSHIHDILSKKDDPEVRVRLREMCSWEIDI